MSEFKVFISYSREDQPFVQAAVKWLKNSQFRSAHIEDPATWGPLGDDVRAVITDKIRQTDTVLLLWSDHAAKSAWVQYEVGIAQAFDVPIRILRAGDSHSKLPTGLGKTGVIKLDANNVNSEVPGRTLDSIDESSLSTALNGLTQQYQRIEQQIQEVSAMLTSKSAGRTTAGIGKQRTLSAAARKRMADAQKTPENHRKRMTASKWK
jgi:TIR domain